MNVWDEAKRQRVLAEHKVDFELIEDILDDAFAIYNGDHWSFGHRASIHGHWTDGRIWLGVFGFLVRRRSGSLYHRTASRELDGERI